MGNRLSGFTDEQLDELALLADSEGRGSLVVEIIIERQKRFTKANERRDDIWLDQQEGRMASERLKKLRGE